MWYFGCPAMESASVDLPDPFGPMMAWVSPLRIVKSTPVRISLGPYSVSTETCRSRISRVDMNSGLLDFGRCAERLRIEWCRYIDEYVVALDAAAIDRDRLRRRQADRFPGRQIEAGSVHVALDLAVADISFRERDLGVRAFVRDRIDGAVAVYDCQLLAANLDCT